MLYVYCPRKSESAMNLAEALNASRLRNFDGLDFWARGKKKKLDEGDAVVCWGNPLPEVDGVRVLNGEDPGTKQEAIRTLRAAGVATVQFLTPDAWSQTLSPNDQKRYIGRMFDHVGGNDLLNPPVSPDYYVYKDLYSHEYRIHSFAGKSIRAGVKTVRDGFTLCATVEDWKRGVQEGRNVAHPWIRSFDGGWRINYDGFTATKEMRTLAHNAVRALGLTFGAVDIAVRASSGEFTVLEVNRAPGIEGNSLVKYVEAVNRWLNGGEAKVEPIGKKKKKSDPVTPGPVAPDVSRIVAATPQPRIQWTATRARA